LVAQQAAGAAVVEGVGAVELARGGVNVEAVEAAADERCGGQRRIGDIHAVLALAVAVVKLLAIGADAQGTARAHGGQRKYLLCAGGRNEFFQRSGLAGVVGGADVVDNGQERRAAVGDVDVAAGGYHALGVYAHWHGAQHLVGSQVNDADAAGRVGRGVRPTEPFGDVAPERIGRGGQEIARLVEARDSGLRLEIGQRHHFHLIAVVDHHVPGVAQRGPGHRVGRQKVDGRGVDVAPAGGTGLGAQHPATILLVGYERGLVAR
nr:hypothetical protein [Tanacetum cinerariifolium]